MRVLFTTLPGYGSFQPLVPVAHALVAAGHLVAGLTRSAAVSATAAKRAGTAGTNGVDELAPAAHSATAGLVSGAGALLSHTPCTAPGRPAITRNADESGAAALGLVPFAARCSGSGRDNGTYPHPRRKLGCFTGLGATGLLLAPAARREFSVRGCTRAVLAASQPTPDEARRHAAEAMTRRRFAPRDAVLAGEDIGVAGTDEIFAGLVDVNTVAATGRADSIDAACPVLALLVHRALFLGLGLGHDPLGPLGASQADTEEAGKGATPSDCRAERFGQGIELLRVHFRPP
jgi:hypothetical protein